MVASKKTQIALVIGASALIAAAFVLWSTPGSEFLRMTESLTKSEQEPDIVAKDVALQGDPTTISEVTTAYPQPVESVPDAGKIKAELHAAIPAFDMVRVGPAGDSVFAGRVTPGKKLELLLDGKVHDYLEPRSTGTFALTPPTLPPGDHQLTLREVGENGESIVSQQSVMVLLSADLVSAPVVALMESDKPTMILAGPGLEMRQPGDDELYEENSSPIDVGEIEEEQEITAKASPIELPKSVAIAAVEAERGRLFVSGHAPKDASVRLYLNDTFLAAGTASVKGRLSFTISSGITDGDYRVRLDEVSPKDGKVLSRAEVPFLMRNAVTMAMTPPTENAERIVEDGAHVVVPGIRTARVEHGDSLWQISQRVYGVGTRYTVIYGANQNQIRNPDQIYPGQVFVLPPNKGGSQN